MTQKTSFKSRMKQAFSFFRSDLRACTPLLVVFGLISAVTVVICYTICVVLGEDMTFTGTLSSLNFLGVTNSGTGIIEIFQYSSANLIYLISIYLQSSTRCEFIRICTINARLICTVLCRLAGQRCLSQKQHRHTSCQLSRHYFSSE